MTPTVYLADPTHVAFFLPLPVRQKGNSKTIRQRRGRRGAFSNAAVAAALRSIGAKPPKAPGLFVSSNEKDEAAERSLVRALRPLAPAEPMVGVLDVTVVFVYPVPATFTDDQRRDALAGIYRPTSTGYHHHDRGNPLKLLEDALQAAGFYGNDSHVCDGDVSKRFGEVAGYDVRVKVVPGCKPCPKGARRKARKA